MNRRDMIIVAVLMNTGLLAILFMMAIHTDDAVLVIEESKPKEIVALTPVQKTNEPISLPLKPVALPQTSAHDELDTVITAYTAGAANAPVLIDESTFRQAVKPAKTIIKEVAPVVKEDLKFVEVTVKRGDSLDKIARANGTSIKALKRANNLSSDRLQIGQLLHVPLDSKKAEVKKSEAKKKVVTSTPAGTEYYTLKSGDNPWKIAKMFHVRFDDLLKLNNLDEGKARRMKAGDKIRVR